MKTATQQITITGLFIALCVIVPFVFHLAGLGMIFLPMFLPILLAGFIIRFPLAMLVGILGPIVSSVLTGMPPLFPTAVSMMVEGMAAAGLASFLFQARKMPLWLVLPLAVVAERIVRVAMIFSILPLFGLPAREWSIAEITLTLPGVALQLFLVPMVLFMLWRANVIKRKLWWKIS
ncbi:MAG: hypothetical protein ONB31_10905 [candidate division KSB1 bacterium]|nr:hypothetical protein [candidate division KSB1 bacterium]MDZ7336408.1 hypothetical protein [candidate division KSB1 bacterium]MDZ7358415.1 hypothetical protein [candidate division KSB1 bacterium]MDZ7401906.1 hypothetical protein [candidate division KSB1 bacterium]